MASLLTFIRTLKDPSGGSLRIAVNQRRILKNRQMKQRNGTQKPNLVAPHVITWRWLAFKMHNAGLYNWLHSFRLNAAILLDRISTSIKLSRPSCSAPFLQQSSCFIFIIAAIVSINCGIENPAHSSEACSNHLVTFGKIVRQNARIGWMKRSICQNADNYFFNKVLFENISLN